MNATIQWAAELSHVREVSLLGAAELQYWTKQLESQRLRPAEHDGAAQVLVTCAAARFGGVRFRELSVSVLVSLPLGAGACLLGAFHSSRLFALAERWWFSTPYTHASVGLSTHPPRIELLRSGTVAFRAARQWDESVAQSPVLPENHGFEGPVFLPHPCNSQCAGKLFFARISGRTALIPFDPNRDELTISPSPDDQALSALQHSGFMGREWQIRDDATHAKSKTYPRDAFSL